MINKKGVALVIANSAYITQPKLKSCKKDGEDMRRRPQWGQVLERGYKKKKSRAKI